MITCYFENNIKAQGGLRHVTVNALIIHENKILLGKRGRVGGKKMLEFGKWGLIGGYLDRDETLSGAIKREAMEESGCQIKDLLLFRINDTPERPKEDRQNVDVVFIAQFVDQIHKDDEEVLELKWFPLDELPPKMEIAFDHGENIELYKTYLLSRHPLPILG